MNRIKGIIRGLTPPFAWALMKKCFKSKKADEKCDPQKSFVKGDFFCPVCGKMVLNFLPLPIYYQEMKEKYPPIRKKTLGETMNRHAYSCPNCGESDRNRLYAMYLSNKFEEMRETRKQYSFLDLAPSIPLQKFIKSYDFIQYRSADLYMDNVDDKVDIMNMNIYSDDQFDIILCSHMLEHVEDDRKAMAELYRVLNPSGFAIIMVPIDLMLDADFEDKSIVSESDRWRYFGQGDHVRAYSKNGFVNKLKETGFVVHQYDEAYFGKWEFYNKGINPHSVLYVVTK